MRGRVGTALAVLLVAALAAGCSGAGSSASGTSTDRSTASPLTNPVPPPPRRQLADYLTRARPAVAAVDSAEARLRHLAGELRSPLASGRRAAAVASIDALATVYADAGQQIQALAPPGALVDANDAFGTTVSDAADQLGLVSFLVSNPKLGGPSAAVQSRDLLLSVAAATSRWKEGVRRVAIREAVTLPGWFTG